MKICFPIIALVSLSILWGCSPSPDDLAEESKRLNYELSVAKNRKDSDSIYREISAVETKAREIFTKKELKEYERKAHGGAAE